MTQSNWFGLVENPLHLGFEVLEASDGIKACNRLQSRDGIDLVLPD